MTTSDRREPAEVIAQAIEAERKAAWFYTTMAQMTADPSVRATLERLAADETSHAATLTELYASITGRQDVEPRLEAAEGSPNLFDFPSTSRRAALRFALKNELTAAELYESQAEMSTDPERRAIYRRLAATEREHAEFVRAQLGRG
jgi:rubrerythrin